MAAHVRGDVSVTINGETYLITPSFKAIAAIEAATGKSMLAISADILAMNITTVALVIFHALRAAGFTALTLDDVGEAVIDGMSEPENALSKAALTFLNGYFMKPGATDGKKPVKAAKKATG